MKIQYLCIPLITICLFGCTSAPENPGPDLVLPPCGALPNCVNSHSGKGGSAIAPLHATAGQWLELKQWLATQDNWTIQVEAAYFVQTIVKTPLLRFRDDVQLLYNPQTGVIQVRSSSRLGISDMGANRSRVESLRAHLSLEAD
ncbi:MAG: DUF1499 domain-containing protein [Halioglobus sp.]